MFARIRTTAVLLAAFVLLLAISSSTFAEPGSKNNRNFGDNLKSPLSTRQDALRQQAFLAKISGANVRRVHQIGNKFVETERLGVDKIWTVLGEFGNQKDPTIGGTVGPKHNKIPEPDRSVDNTTIWRKKFNRKYYKRLLFSEKPGANSMHNFYLEQSTNRYTVIGDVTDWVTVPYNEAFYGNNNCGYIICPNSWNFVQDATNVWYQSQMDKAKTADEINAYLSQFDVWDRYDYDGDGNFDESDGYIDHFQTVHAGVAEEMRGGKQGTDAIWSHKGYAFSNLIGSAGPSGNLLGGTQIGGSNYWVGDYTVEPENGGLGVFSHEFAHDLGVPDLYDPSANTGGADNSTGHWTLMAYGSHCSSGLPEDGLGSNPTHMSAYEKLYLGWSNYSVVSYGTNTNLTLGPAEKSTGDTQTLIVTLPPKEIQTHVGTPYEGAYFYFSNQGNNLDNSMTRSVTLPAGNPSLSAKVNYAIEEGWDYAYLTVNGTNVHTNLSTNDDPNRQNEGEGITGSSDDAWVDLTADLSAYAGQTVTIGFRYWTDAAAVENGLMVDNIAITGNATDGGETDPGWAYDGFLRTDGNITNSYSNAYFAEYRNYRMHDRYLETGPYNYGFLDNPNLQNWVEHYPYQPGLLVWYYDTSFEDNNVGEHCADGRCGGLYLPVDAHPKLLIAPNGMAAPPIFQSWDSTFGLNPVPELCLHLSSVQKCIPGLKPRRTFNDSKSYWVPPDPSIGHYGWASVPVPHTGTRIKVKSVNNGKMNVQVKFAVP